MKRNIYDKSCYQAINGAIGRLQTVFTLPVLANDTVSINLLGNFKLSKLRRWLALDANIHIAAYFVKHRWVYDNWDDFIKNSLSNERGTPTTLATTTLNALSGTYYHDWLGSSFRDGDTIPRHYLAGMNKIWNRWYRVPNVDTERSETDQPSSAGDLMAYGLPVARLPNFWNTGLETSGLTADSTITEAGGADSMTLLDIANIQAEYQDELDREWFSHRYRDIMASKWGSNGITNEVDDDQAELLMDKTIWASGADIHGTDQSSLGDYVGKTQTMVNFQVPPRYFNEHGMIWVVMAVRFPSICADEAHYTSLNTLTADNFLGLPEVARSKPPIELKEDDVFIGGESSQSYGSVPMLNWYRFNPNRITHDMDAEGFPFLRASDIDPSGILGHSDITYEANSVLWESGEQDRFFASTSEFKHWNMVSKAEIEVRSVLPTASESVFAGARHIN